MKKFTKPSVIIISVEDDIIATSGGYTPETTTGSKTFGNTPDHEVVIEG